MKKYWVTVDVDERHRRVFGVVFKTEPIITDSLCKCVEKLVFNTGNTNISVERNDLLLVKTRDNSTPDIIEGEKFKINREKHAG